MKDEDWKDLRAGIYYDPISDAVWSIRPSEEGWKVRLHARLGEFTDEDEWQELAEITATHILRRCTRIWSVKVV